MKKMSAVILSLTMFFSLCACTGDNNDPINKMEEIAEPKEEQVKEDSYTEDLIKDVMLSFGTNTAAYGSFDFSSVFDLGNNGKTDSNPNEYMAHNVYSDPDLTGTSGKFDGFIIDFKADYAPNGTYWALCNWEMDLTSLQKTYPSASGGGAYCGLQKTNDGSTAIMSFWNIECGDTIITASLEYPQKNGNDFFSNEGSGANYIPDYDWEEGHWYRMYLRCFEDEKSGHTFVDMWIMDLEDESLDRICCYDTKLTNSCFTGGMSQFMENYDYTYCTDVRSFQYANLNVLDHESQEWVHLTNSKLSIDTWWGNKKGTFAFGSSESFLWGIVCGYGDDTAALNSDISSDECIR